MLKKTKNTIKAETSCSERETVITFHTTGMGVFAGFLVVPKDEAETIKCALNTGLMPETSDSCGLEAVLSKEKK